VTFADTEYDESNHQASMVDFLQTEHSTVHCGPGTIGAVFPDVVWHTEKPLVRTAPAPLFLLSRLVNDNGYKVVLTGEGADEILAGYDIFKEDKIRRFLARDPDSAMRPLILRRLYPYLKNSPTRSLEYARRFFDSTNSVYDQRFRSHVPRWDLTSKTQLFFADAVKSALADYDSRDELDSLVPRAVSGLDPLSRAQYLEIKTLLSGYLLCSQGDRMSMAHSVEGRFPFLDHRVIEYCARIPARIRMPALREKDVLKRSMRGHIPDSVLDRTKQPYRAPDASSFLGGDEPDYVKELLSPANLKKSGYFNPRATEHLLAKCRKGRAVGFKDNMAVVGIISTLLLHDQFVENFHSKARETLKRKEDAEFEGIEVAD
jgi:asparagine synthase (glutamine-hydrolysing)